MTTESQRIAPLDEFDAAVSSAPAPPGVALHVLQNDVWRVGVLPGTGASLAFGRVCHDGQWFDLLRPTRTDRYRSVEDCASFVMLPWSNRVAGAVLRFGGEQHRMRINADDGTAIHGTARDFPWDVELATGNALIATFDSRAFSGVNYPWPFTARLLYQLTGSRLTITTSLRNEHDEPVPVGFGHHPYLAKALTGPDDEALLQLPFDRYFETERAIPSGPAVPVEPRVDFRELRPLGPEFVDDCLTGRLPGAPLRVVYPSSRRIVTIGADDVFTHAVVYVPTDRPYFAVEPVTNANDAFTLHERGVAGSGLVVLPPGETLEGSTWFDVGPWAAGNGHAETAARRLVLEVAGELPDHG
jgi:aldose 1-epimerase